MPRKSSKKSPRRKAGPSTDSVQRLQRLLASAGFGSRRQCEELIEAGRVTVDGDVVTRLGTSVDSHVNKVRVDGVLLKKQKLVYFAVNKPVGVVTTNRDPQGRPRVVDLVPPDERVFPVGRLDRNSEGLILLTNDGELAQRLTHPKFGVRKVYRVTVAGKVDTETMRQMRNGIYIAEGFVKVEGAKLLKTRSRATEMEIVLREGKNREIRRVLARLGHKVQHLRRIAVGPLKLGDVPAGAYRVVRRDEVEKLWMATEGTSPPASPKRPSSGKKRGSKGKKPIGGAAGKTVNRRPQKKASRAFPTISVEKGDYASVGTIIGGESNEAAESKPGRRKQASKTGARSSKNTRSQKGVRSRKSVEGRSSSRTKRSAPSESRGGTGRASGRGADRRSPPKGKPGTKRKPATKNRKRKS